MKIIFQNNANEPTKDFFDVDLVNDVVNDDTSVKDLNKEDPDSIVIWKKCGY